MFVFGLNDFRIIWKGYSPRIHAFVGADWLIHYIEIAFKKHHSMWSALMQYIHCQCIHNSLLYWIWSYLCKHQHGSNCRRTIGTIHFPKTSELKILYHLHWSVWFKTWSPSQIQVEVPFLDMNRTDAWLQLMLRKCWAGPPQAPINRLWIVSQAGIRQDGCRCFPDYNSRLKEYAARC